MKILSINRDKVKSINGGVLHTWLVFQVLIYQEKNDVEIGLLISTVSVEQVQTAFFAEAGVNPDTRVKDLTDDEVKKIASIIADTQTVKVIFVENRNEHQETSGNWMLLRIRHRKSLPVRGQKTKTNARTRKGPRKTVANKKK